MLHFFLGGARSGKSNLAEQRARVLGCEQGKQLVYLATAMAGDAEMEARIEHHQSLRGDDWLLVEEPLLLAEALQQQASDSRCIVLECLTLWATNLLFHENKDLWAHQRQQFLKVLPQLPGEIIIVSNEIGQGIVPMGADNRRFVDEMGFLHQQVASLSERVSFVVAGLVQELK